ncbi:hypothetical protein M514_04422 [Trichuris suis]|uniref:CCHC-type domain-containing protein n=1 Tax=Trichuris suis TaxID=68888 RepID=A0A085MZ53_9BILA|nr:hypothetical protein M514_04422 [Trichuris suis]
MVSHGVATLDRQGFEGKGPRSGRSLEGVVRSDNLSAVSPRELCPGVTSPAATVRQRLPPRSFRPANQRTQYRPIRLGGRKRSRTLATGALTTLSLRNTDLYDSEVKALAAFFTPKVNVCVERYRFRKRGREIGETVGFYVTELKDLAATCAFGALDDELVRDQLIESTSYAAIREKLLAVDDLTLEQAISIPRQMETAKKEAPCLHGATDSNDINALKVRNQPPSPARENIPPKPSTHQSPLEECFRCGSTVYLANAAECRARNLQCRYCGKVGRLARMCRSQLDQQVMGKSSSSVEALEVDQVSKRDCLCITIRVFCDDCCFSLDCMLDTGSPSQSFLCRFGKELPFCLSSAAVC